MTESRYQRLVAETRSRIEEVGAEQLRADYEAGRQGQVIDVREPAELGAGRLPGAMAVPRGVLEAQIEKVVPDVNAELVLYCQSGGRSALAAASLAGMGYTRVRSLAGGFSGWAGAGLPVDAAG